MSPVVSIVITSVTGSAAAIVAAMSGLKERSEKYTDKNRQQTEVKPSIPDEEDKLPVISPVSPQSPNEKPGKCDKEDKQQASISLWDINPLPLMLLVIGIAAGSILGMLARNNHWLGSDLSSEIKKWTDVGIAENDVVARLFEMNYPYSPYTRPYTQTMTWLGSDLNVEVKRWTDVGLPQDDVARRLFELEYPTVSPGKASTVPVTPIRSTGGSILYTVDSALCMRLLNKITKEQFEELPEELRNSTVRQWQELPEIITNTITLANIVEKVLCAPT